MKYRREIIPGADDLDAFDCGQRKLPYFATKQGRGASTVMLFIIIAVVFVLKANVSSGSVSFAMDDSALGVACKDYAPVFIAYSEIQEVNLCKTFPMEQAVACVDWDGGWCGTYRSDELGEYTLFAYSSAGAFIMVRSESGLLIFNAVDQKTTEDIYRKLLEKAPAQA